MFPGELFACSACSILVNAVIGLDNVRMFPGELFACSARSILVNAVIGLDNPSLVLGPGDA
jgi:hypothetical protein